VTTKCVSCFLANQLLQKQMDTADISWQVDAPEPKRCPSSTSRFPLTARRPIIQGTAPKVQQLAAFLSFVRKYEPIGYSASELPPSRPSCSLPSSVTLATPSSTPHPTKRDGPTPELQSSTARHDRHCARCLRSHNQHRECSPSTCACPCA
jgi:hypothetical protein